MSAGSVLLVAVIYTQTEDFSARACTLVERALVRKTGETAHVGAIRVDLLGPALEVHDLTLRHAATGDTLLSVRSARAPLVLGRRGLGVGTLRIERPEVHLHLEADGRLRELRDLRPGDGEPLTRLPWWSLELRDGAFVLDLPDGAVALTGLQIAPVDGPVADVSGTLDLRYKSLHEHTDLRWGGVRIGPERIDAPAVRLDTHALQVDGSARYDLGGAVDVRLSLRPDVEELNPLLKPPTALHGDYDVDLHLYGPADALQADALVSGRDIGLDLPGKSVPINHNRFGDAVLPLHAEGDTVTLAKGRVDWGDGRVWINGQVARDGTVSRLRLMGEDLGLDKILHQLDSAPHPWIELHGDPELDLVGTISPFELHGDFELNARDLVVKSGPIATHRGPPVLALAAAHASGQIRVEQEHVVLEITHLRSGRTSGTGTADIGFAPTGPLDLTLAFDRVNLADFGPLGDARLTGTGTLAGRIKGPFDHLNLTGRGELDGFSATGIPYADHLEADLASDMRTLTLKDATAVRGRTRYHGDWAMNFQRWWMDTDLLIDAGRVEDLLRMFLDVDVAHGALTGRLSLHGPLRALDGEAVLDLRDGDLLNERFPTGSAHAWMRNGKFTLDDLKLLRDDGAAGLVARGTIGAGWAVNMDLLADGFDLATLDNLQGLPVRVAGRPWLSARVGGTLFTPEPRGRVGVHHAVIGETPVPDSLARFDTVDGTLRWQLQGLGTAVAAHGQVDLWTDHAWDVDATLVDLPLHALYPTANDGGAVRALASGVLRASGSDAQRPQTDLDLSALSVSWSRHRLEQAGTASFSAKGSAWSFEDLHLRGGRTDVRLDANNLSGELAVEGGGQLDLDLARAFVPGLTRADGRADVSVVLRGAGADQDTLVNATVHADLLEHESFPAQLEDTTAELLATRDKFNLLSLEGELGGGQVQAHGRIDAQNWYPTRFALEGHASDAQVQWIDTLPPAIGDADVRFDGPIDQLLLSGDVQIREMVFSDRIDWEDWLVEFRDDLLVSGPPPEEAGLFNLNVHIVGDESIQLRNNVAEGRASADLRVIGDTARPGLMGWARSVNAIATIQDREFEVERGDVRWNDPWSWDPQLDLDLLTDLTSRDQTYRVTYRVLGPLSGWRTETRSDPTLSQADINALLWFGVTADDLEGSGQLYAAIGQAAADMVLTDFFVSGQVQGAEEVNQLVDRVDITTGVTSRGEFSPDPHLVVERRFPELGDTRATYEWNMTRRDDWLLRLDNRVTHNFTLSAWYASQSRGSSLGNAGAVGLDARVRREWE